MPKKSLVIERFIHVDMRQGLREFRDRITEETLTIALRQTKKHSPVKTGKLKRSIRKISATSIGTSVYYALYQEEGTQYNAPRFYFKRGLEDANRAMEKIVYDALRESMR